MTSTKGKTLTIETKMVVIEAIDKKLKSEVYMYREFD